MPLLFTLGLFVSHLYSSTPKEEESERKRNLLELSCSSVAEPNPHRTWGRINSGAAPPSEFHRTHFPIIRVERVSREAFAKAETLREFLSKFSGLVRPTRSRSASRVQQFRFERPHLPDSALVGRTDARAKPLPLSGAREMQNILESVVYRNSICVRRPKK